MDRMDRPRQRQPSRRKRIARRTVPRGRGALIRPRGGKETPFESCGISSDEAETVLGPVGPEDEVTVSSNDNRAFAPDEFAEFPNPDGGLVKLTVPVGEPASLAAFPSAVPSFAPTGFPTCTADLGAQDVKCTGLVEFGKYKLVDGAEEAEGTAEEETGTLTESLEVHGGDRVELKNSANRTLADACTSPN